METFTLALVQHASPVGETAPNLGTIASWARKAKDAGATLVCFPELSITGHAGHPDMIKDAEAVPDGKSCDELAGLAKELGIHICAGIAEIDRGIHYNTQFIVGPEGYIGKQRKVHLSRDEYFFFRAGTSLPVFDLPFARVGIAVCYDNEVPEVSRCLAVAGAEVLLCPHAARFGAWPDNLAGRRRAVEEQKAHWRLLHACRAYDNGVFVALVNTAGQSAANLPDVEANHPGGCLIFGPDGGLVAESATDDIVDEMVVATLDGVEVSKRRSEVCFNLKTRKPEVFGILSRPTE